MDLRCVPGEYTPGEYTGILTLWRASWFCNRIVGKVNINIDSNDWNYSMKFIMEKMSDEFKCDVDYMPPLQDTLTGWVSPVTILTSGDVVAIQALCQYVFGVWFTPTRCPCVKL